MLICAIEIIWWSEPDCGCQHGSALAGLTGTVLRPNLRPTHPGVPLLTDGCSPLMGALDFPGY